jgi:integrase/recombinase XerD
VSALAPTLEAFFTDRLARQRQASPHTVAAYRDTFRLLLAFVHQRSGKPPCHLDLADLDATVVGDFLTHLETHRGNSVRTRNARLAAIHSFFHFAAFRHPEHAALIQRVLAIPHKRFERALVTFLDRPELESLLATPDRSTFIGRRDHALLLLAVQTGLRLSELTGLRLQDVHLGSGPHLRCFGKGRKERITPLTRQSVAVLRTWLHERAGQPDDRLFPSRLGGRLSADAVQRLVRNYTQIASRRQPSLDAKTVTPHVLRHTNAMQLLTSGVDTSVIALWLGHESVQTTQIYLHADLSLKERALASTAPPHTKPGRYRPPDTLLAFLASL